VTTYQKNDFGQADNSYLDSETLHQSAYIIRFLKGRITSKYGRHKLANDGTRFGAEQALVTSAVIRAELIAGYYLLEQMGIVENAGAFAQYLVVERSLTDPTRVDVLYPPDLVNQLRVFALQYQFRLQYQESRAGTDKGDPNQLPHAVNASLGRSK
jgi:phage tail sheath gpL-like